MVYGEHGAFSEDEARAIGEAIGIDWPASLFDVAQFRMGLEVELGLASEPHTAE
jgi:hypothetical protein